MMRADFVPQGPNFWQTSLSHDTADFYVGNRYQRGGSLGSFLKGLLRFVVPIVKSAGKQIGKQALRTGAAIATDVAEGKPLRESAIDRAGEGVEQLIMKRAPKRKRAAGKRATGKRGKRQIGRGKRQKGKGVGKRPAPRTSINAPATKKKRAITKKRDTFGFY